MKYDGLTDEEVVKLQEKYGKNIIEHEEKEKIVTKIYTTIKKPLIILLIIFATFWFIIGNKTEGTIVIVCVLSIIELIFLEKYKASKTLEKLNNYAKSEIVVVRNKMRVKIDISELVPGDMMVIYEGTRIPADGFIIKCNNLKIDESVLTGEKTPINKTSEKYNGKKKYRPDYCYQGTMVIQGSGIVIVDKIGNNTEYGSTVNNNKKTINNDSNLEKEIKRFSKWVTFFILLICSLVFLLNYTNLSNIDINKRILDSLLPSITIVLSLIPEEISVVLLIFLSLGIKRMANKNALIKNFNSIEKLNTISILCVDKTGIITSNNMEIADIESNYTENEILESLCLCSTKNSGDPIEKAIYNYAHYLGIDLTSLFKNKKTREYMFEDNINGTAYHIENDYVISFKGNFDSIIKLCKLTQDKEKKLRKKVLAMQKRGFYVIALAGSKFPTIRDVKDSAQEYTLDFMGIIGFIDPPKKEVSQKIKLCKKAGIKVVLMTDDNKVTASSVGEMIGMGHNLRVVTGEELDNMFDEELDKVIMNIDLFSQITSQHKLRIVKSFQRNGIQVAITGNKVNDEPALKKANIGITMGKAGTDMSKETADLIILDDNFSTIVESIKDSRRIYDNIKRAIEYIIIIHIPIIFSVLLSAILKIPVNKSPLLPVHIMLLEFLIDPTVSVVLERMPAKDDIMNRNPGHIGEKIINRKSLFRCFIQGIMILLVTFGPYYYLIKKDVLLARTIGFLIIILCNVFLVIENYSISTSVFRTIQKFIRDKILLLSLLLVLSISYILIYSPVNIIGSFTKINSIYLLYVFILSFIGIFWYELVKLIKKHKKTH